MIGAQALCPVDYLLVEWHVHFVDPPERLASLAIRLALDKLIQHSCPPRTKRRPRVIEHDERENNKHIRVLGLSERARWHNGLEIVRRTNGTNGVDEWSMG